MSPARLFIQAVIGCGIAALLVSFLDTGAGVRADATYWSLEGDRPAAAESVRPAGAGAGSGIGPLQRDSQGRIVPIPESEARGDENDAKGLAHPEPPSGGRRPGLPGPNPFSGDASGEKERTLQAEHARRIQAEIDRALSQCRAGAARAAPSTGCAQGLAEQLEARDREVRAHELAHYHAGQPYSRAPEYFFVTGPDGRQFAVGGVTPMDTALDPGAPTTAIAKLRILHRAALAPRAPSVRDRELADRLKRMIDALERR